jgi:hypothetical protein
VAPGSGLALVGPSYINDRGEIAGNGVLANGDTHAFVLIPCGDGDEGCEDDAAHTTAAAPVSPVSAMQRLTVIPDNAALRPQMMRLFGGRWVPWYRGFGASPQD